MKIDSRAFKFKIYFDEQQGGQRQDMLQTWKLGLELGKRRTTKMVGCEGQGSPPSRSPIALAPETPPSPPCHNGYFPLSDQLAHFSGFT